MCLVFVSVCACLFWCVGAFVSVYVFWIVCTQRQKKRTSSQSTRRFCSIFVSVTPWLFCPNNDSFFQQGALSSLFRSVLYMFFASPLMQRGWRRAFKSEPTPHLFITRKVIEAHFLVLVLHFCWYSHCFFSLATSCVWTFLYHCPIILMLISRFSSSSETGASRCTYSVRVIFFFEFVWVSQILKTTCSKVVCAFSSVRSIVATWFLLVLSTMSASSSSTVQSEFFPKSDLSFGVLLHVCNQQQQREQQSDLGSGRRQLQDGHHGGCDIEHEGSSWQLLWNSLVEKSRLISPLSPRSWSVSRCYSQGWGTLNFG